LRRAVAREMPQVSLEDALKLVHLYAEKESPECEAAAMKWLRRYLDERSPTLKNFAEITARLAKREPGADSLRAGDAARAYLAA
jgi:hypothetical protein